MGTRLILVGWDAADWKLMQPLMDAGRMPTLRGIVENGVAGSLLCGQPLVPAAQWTSVVTGKRPWQHGIFHQAEWSDPVQGLVPVSARQRQVMALWEILEQAGRRSLIVGWPATHESRGKQATIVSNRFAEPTAGPGIRPWPPAAGGTYWPENLGARLDRLRVSPEEVQGDTIAHFIPNWKRLDPTRDRRLGQLRVVLAKDWSHQAALMELLKVGEWDFAAINFPALGAITSWFLPYLAPRREWVAEAEFELFQQVIPTACNLLDRLLHKLIEATGKQSAVVIASSCGVSPQLPPHFPRSHDSEIWKSPYGIFAAAGPGFSQKAQVFGASVQDVTPTLLTWFGLPIGEDMEGRVLTETFAAMPDVKRVESWEPRPAASQVAQGAPPDPVSEPVTKRRFNRDYAWNRVRFFVDAGRYAEALPRLEELFRSFPERAEVGHLLFQCQLTLKQVTAAAETLEVLLEAIPPGLWSLLPRAELLLAQGKRKDARTLAEDIRQLNSSDPLALRRLGMILWRLRDWKALEELAQKALLLDPHEPLAWLAQAEASLRLSRPAESAQAAQRAIRLNYFLPQAHLALARALLAQGQWTEGREAMQAVLRLQPNHRGVEKFWRRTESQGGAAP